MHAGSVAGVVAEHFADDGRFPNSRLPLVIYRQALERGSVSAAQLEQLFAVNGWPPAWRSTIFTYHHYHSSAHETLGVASGTACVLFGGPDGRGLELVAGDVVAIPAGVAHCRVSSSADFLVVGCYPPGQCWDLLRGEPGERPRADKNVDELPLPLKDPVGGERGPLPGLWAR